MYETQKSFCFVVTPGSIGATDVNLSAKQLRIAGLLFCAFEI